MIVVQAQLEVGVLHEVAVQYDLASVNSVAEIHDEGSESIRLSVLSLKVILELDVLVDVTIDDIIVDAECREDGSSGKRHQHLARYQLEHDVNDRLTVDAR